MSWRERTRYYLFICFRLAIPLNEKTDWKSNNDDNDNNHDGDNDDNNNNDAR